MWKNEKAFYQVQEDETEDCRVFEKFLGKRQEITCQFYPFSIEYVQSFSRMLDFRDFSERILFYGRQ